MDINYVIKQYFDKKISIIDIAKDLKTYPNKIRRLILKNGKKLRTKSEAQTLALAEGRHPHPTKGKKHSFETKEKISEKISESWKNISNEELTKRQDKARKNWNKMSNEQKDNLFKKASISLKKTSKFGSKIERHIYTQLLHDGYDTEFHKERSIRGTKFQIDIFLPKLMVAIEVDGVGHVLPIWGEEALVKRKLADEKKKKMILGSSLKLIRIICPHRHTSQKIERDAWNGLKNVLNQLDVSNETYFEVSI